LQCITKKILTIFAGEYLQIGQNLYLCYGSGHLQSRDVQCKTLQNTWIFLKFAESAEQGDLAKFCAKVLSDGGAATGYNI
jgi:hypothetical protein